jgi:hypothetical protein
MKELTLDYAKWRCGGNNPGLNVLGEGRTCLLNDQGFMCCLGQISLQLKSDLTQESIKDINSPGSLSLEVPLLSGYQDDIWIDEDGEEVNDSRWDDTDLSQEAMAINDNPLTTPEEKIVKLQELFGEEGYIIKVINKP